MISVSYYEKAFIRMNTWIFRRDLLIHHLAQTHTHTHTHKQILLQIKNVEHGRFKLKSCRKCPETTIR